MAPGGKLRYHYNTEKFRFAKNIIILHFILRVYFLAGSGYGAGSGLGTGSVKPPKSMLNVSRDLDTTFM